MYSLILEIGRNLKLPPFLFITSEVGRLIECNFHHNLAVEIDPKLILEIDWTLILKIDHDLVMEDLSRFHPKSWKLNKHQTLIHIIPEVGNPIS